MTTTPATPSSLTTWKIDPAHSTAEFKVKHMMISNVKGNFKGISGVLTTNEADHTRATIEATIPVATVATGDDQRDGHLKSGDFFEAEKYPDMIFKSTEVTRTAHGEHAVVGELTLHGVTRTVSLAVDGPSEPAKDPWGNTRIGLSATTRINRKDFGLGWNAALEAGGVLVGEDVTITLEIQFIKS